jgi:hypothetical protein
MGSVWTTVRLEHTGTIQTIKDSCARRMVSERPMTSCVERHATLGTHIPLSNTSSVERLDLASLTMMPVLMAVVMMNCTAGSRAGVSSCQSLAMGSVGFSQFTRTLGRGSTVHRLEHVTLGNRLVMGPVLTHLGWNYFYLGIFSAQNLFDVCNMKMKI